ncbi:MAG: helix-turn-helix domain-containing protein [Nocardioides sp.]
MTIDTDFDHELDTDEADLHLDVTGQPGDEPSSGANPVETIGQPAEAPDQLVEVRRRTGLAASLGAGAALVAVAYLARAAAGGSVVDWVVGVVLALIGVVNLASLLDARTPLLVADELGVRLRLGRTWVGLPWGGIHEVELAESRRWWRDGLLTVRTHYVQRVLEDLDPGARRLAGVNRRLHAAPLAVPLGLGTRLVGADPDLASALRTLSAGRTPVLDAVPVTPAHDQVADVVHDEVDDEVDAEVAEVFDGVELDETGTLPAVETDPAPRAPRLPDPRPALAHLIGVVAARFDRFDDDEPEIGLIEEPAREPEIVRPVVASATPPPAREVVVARRAEVRHDRPELDEALGDDTQVWDAVRAMAEDDPGLDEDVDEPDLELAPVLTPVIGPPLAAARERLGLDVDELAERTRIRPHVIEAIEVDDFGACGGDFYARGHLRTLGRVLGVEAAPMLATYDERYADAPIDPRRVFEAELAGAGSLRATRGGPNWSVLVAAVMALVLCWSVARLVTGGAGHTPDVAVLSGSGGTHHSRSVLTAPVPVTVTAAGGGVRVVVRDGLGKLVFSGDLSYGQSRTFHASAPVRIQSSDGSLQVSVDGQDRGRMGPADRPISRTYRDQKPQR